MVPADQQPFRIEVSPGEAHERFARFSLEELLAGMTSDAVHALDDDGPKGNEII
jgi:hypothetical protein